MRKHSKNLPPTRCFKHKDFTSLWKRGPKCFKNAKPFLKIYYPFDFIWNPKNKKLEKSNIRYFLK